MKKGYLFFVFFVFSGFFAFGQSGSVEVFQDSRIDTLLEKKIQISMLNPGIEGYRIQVYFESGNNSKSKAYQTRDKFKEQFEGVNAYVIFNEPYYKVRVGDYRSMMDAEGDLQRISREYPNAFIVPDFIHLPKLNP